jgi:hypothetical protein
MERYQMSDNNAQPKSSEYCIEQLNQWTSTVSEHLPILSKPQATVLALWSFGMAVVKSCALTTVMLFLAALLKVKENTMRQRLREWCYDSDDKRGDKRVDLNIPSCFPFLLRWVMAWWHGNQVALALDATTVSDRFTILSVSVVYRACAIPVAWTVLRGNTKGSWNKEWFRMLQLLKPSIPKDYLVIVMTDRGLYSPELLRQIRKMGWHPFMRVNAIGTFLPEGEPVFRPISSFARQPGQSWQGTGIAFKTRRIPSTLLARWEEGMDEAWFILTDLSPEASDICWYAMRAWIEQGFRTTKRGGWQWNRTRMKDPKRAERLLLAISVATLWLLSVGGEVDESISESTFPEALDSLEHSPRKRKTTRQRLISVFRRGWIAVLVSLIRHEPLPLGSFIPEPWPAFPCEPSGP